MDALAAHPRGDARIWPEVIEPVLDVGAIDHREIRGEAWLEPADLGVEAKRRGGDGRCARQCLPWRHPLLSARQRHGERQVEARRAAGVEVGRHGYRHAGIEQVAGGHGPLAKIKRGQGKAHGDDARLGEPRDADGRHVFEVIGGRGADLGGERGPAAVTQLVGVKLRHEPVRGGGREHAPRFLHAERGLLDEDVAEAREAATRDLGHQFRAQHRDVVFSSLAVLTGNGMSTKQRRHDAQGLRRREPLVHPQQLQFGLHRQPVSALALDRRYAERRHRAEMRRAARHELIFAGRARQGYRPLDPATAARDLQVGPPDRPLLELLGAPPRERQVRVAVHEPGDDERSAGRAPVFAGQVGRDLVCPSHPADPSVAPAQGRARDRAERSLRGTGDGGGQEADIGEHRHVVVLSGRRWAHDAVAADYNRRIPMQTFTHFYIGGAWQAPIGSERLEVRSASTEEVIGSIPLGTPEDVNRAVEAARIAFAGPWGSTTPAERADWLTRLAAALKARVPDIAKTIAMEVGSPITMATAVQAGSPVHLATSFAELARTYAFEQTIGNSLVVREPYGVIGAITPWNYPLHQILAKVGAALAAGCTMVLKPSEIAPLNAYALADACLEIGLPAGVLNIVHGVGPVVGEAIASHPDVDLVSFTGSLRAGKRVAALGAAAVKKVTLELGGKSACIVLDDAPLDKAVPGGIKHALLNSGQTCSAWTRMVVPRHKHDDALELASRTMASLTLGDPLDPATRLGPLISAQQKARVEGYIEAGRREGATLVTGGRRPAEFSRGHFVQPTLFADVTPAMTIAREEIFGPVVCVLSYDTEEEAIGIANDTIYGLAGGVWSSDPDRALRVARRIRAGQVDINGGRFNAVAPFGGYKQSGIGREMGVFGLEEFLQVKALAR